jgi:hypothetical protein
LSRWTWGLGLAVLLLMGESVCADRVPSSKTVLPASTGTRVDITVPYLTNGRSNLGAYYVAPRIYASPDVQDKRNPAVKPVFNLIFYGSGMSFGDQNNGATQRQPNMLRPPRP